MRVSKVQVFKIERFTLRYTRHDLSGKRIFETLFAQHGDNMKYILLLAIVLLPFDAIANEYDSPLTEVISPPINDLIGQEKSYPIRSDIEELISLQTPVKSQGRRGTCTMFTTIGVLEHVLIRKGYYSVSEIDLSEEYMEYIIMKDKQSEGSSTSRNFKAVYKYGFVTEKTWPYVGQKWLDVDDFTISRQTCGHLVSKPVLLKSCLLGHRDPRLLAMNKRELRNFDPEFISIKTEAYDLRDRYLPELFKKRKSHKLKYVSSVKKLLLDGQAVIMGTKLYYGSWNSSKTTKLDIQERDKEKFYQGIVTYPEKGSRDRRISGEKGGGHSIIIVGYDDSKVVHSRMQMEDGSWKNFTYKGVYYFKNSWGTRGFGKKFELNGKSYKGYGMITQKYAHEFGSFFQVN